MKISISLAPSVPVIIFHCGSFISPADGVSRFHRNTGKLSTIINNVLFQGTLVFFLPAQFGLSMLLRLRGQQSHTDGISCKQGQAFDWALMTGVSRNVAMWILTLTECVQLETAVSRI